NSPGRAWWEIPTVRRERADRIGVLHRLAQGSKRSIPLPQHCRRSLLDPLRCTTGRFRGCRMPHVLIGKCGGSSRDLLEFAPRGVCQRAKEDHCFQGPGSNQCRKPAISIIGYRRIINVVLGTVLIIDAIEKSVEHDIAAVDTQLSQEALSSMTGHADQDAADHRLVLAHKASQRVRGRYRDRMSAFWNLPPVRLPE